MLRGIHHLVGIGGFSPVSLFLDEPSIDQLPEGLSDLSISSVSKCWKRTGSLQATFIAQIGQGDPHGRVVPFLYPIQEEDIQLESRGAEGSQPGEVDPGHFHLLK